MGKISRRSFLGKAAVVTGAAVVPSVLFSGCAGLPIVPYSGKSIDRLLDEGARVMWCGAHPDDEVLVGSILAKAGPRLGNAIYFLVLNHGDGGACHLPEGCVPSLADVRGRELEKVAELYKAQLQHEWYYNAPLPVSSFPKRHEIAKLWKDHKDPVPVCAKAIRKFRPDLILTFNPHRGFTGHPEHQLASRFITAGIRMAADPKIKLGDLESHKVEHVYYGTNKYFLYRLFGADDPGPITEIFDATQPCIKGKPCYQIMADFSLPHRTQLTDMGAVREMRAFFKKNYLFKVDPFTEILDPYEKVKV